MSALPDPSSVAVEPEPTIDDEINQIPDHDERETTRRAMLGVHVEQELAGSKVVRLLHERLRLDAEEATKTLETADAENPRLVRSLQNRIAVYRALEAVIKEAIDGGQAAAAELSMGGDNPAGHEG